jgi:hypothetical protein
VAVAEPVAFEEVSTFLGREHLHVPLLGLPPDSVFADGRRLPSPAVLVARNGHARGVAHPVRFANLRMVSFATELAPLLAPDAGGEMN